MAPLSCLFAVGVMVIPSCAKRSDPTERLSAEFKAYVGERAACVDDAECTLVFPGCPLGCGAAVRAELVDDVQQKARELVAEHDRLEGACKYKCAHLRAACKGGRCTAILE